MLDPVTLALDSVLVCPMSLVCAATHAHQTSGRLPAAKAANRVTVILVAPSLHSVTRYRYVCGVIFILFVFLEI